MARHASLNSVTAILALVTFIGSAQVQPAAETRLDVPIEQTVARIVASQGEVLPPTPNPPPGQGSSMPPNPMEGATPLTLDDALKAALDHNLNIAVSRINPELNDTAIASYIGFYKPALTSTLATQSTTTPSTSTVGGANAGQGVVNGLSTFNGGVAQNLRWGGGNYSVTLNNNKTTTSAQTSLYNPTYNTLWSAQFNQPLLQGLRIDANRQQLAVTKINRDITDTELRAQIVNTLSNVKEAYWNYVFAVQSVQVSQQQLDLANQLVSENQIRVQVGTMALLDVVTAQSQAATAQQNLVVAQGTMRTSELALKQLMVGGTEDPLWNQRLNPVDRPDFQPTTVDVQAAVRNAISQRTDLQIAKKTVESNGVTVKYLKDQSLPQATLTALYGWAGLGGSQLLTQGTGVNRTVIGSVPGGYNNALTSLLDSQYPRWIVSFNVGYPLGYNAQRANLARAELQQTQLATQIKQTELQVVTDVTNAAINVQSNAQRVDAAHAARQLAEASLNAERVKFDVGLSTNYLVIQQLGALATAQNNELQAILAYRTSQVELERLQQTTLQSSSVTIVGAATTSVR
jgi:outer membrane protein TolC